MKQGKSMRFACIALTAFCLSGPALAQSTPSTGALPSPDEVNKRDTLTIAGGVGYTADYEGSDDYRLIPAAAIRGRYHGIAFTTRGAYLYVDVVPRGSSNIDFEFGPAIGARFNKRRHIHDDVVELLPKTNTAIEAGAFAGIGISGITNPYDRLGFRVDVLHDIGNAHESTVISPNVEFSTPVSRSTYVGLNAGLEFVSNKYADYYYTITPAASLVSGLPAFDADGGLKNWKAGLLVNQSLSGDLLHGFSIFGTGQYSHLQGDFKRSPIVSIRGSASQWLGALGVAYTW
jgi:outer membrane scaffolding protein for murein synthesis (MipA/OmpV family)